MSWLDDITQEQIEKCKFPIKEVLQNSFYYPSCGFDGGIVKDCNTLGRDFGINSFIYCDYATGEKAFRKEQNTFLGYHILGSRSVTHLELIPNGWQPQFPPKFNLEEYQRYRDTWKPFINWVVYERDDNRDDNHGQKRFSLLYLGGEGIATYQALYWSNRTSPKAFAIIQSGEGFGFNWTDFRKKDGELAWVVNNNPFGHPEIIYYGGAGSDYADSLWDVYLKDRIIKLYYKNEGEVVVAKKSPLLARV